MIFIKKWWKVITAFFGYMVGLYMIGYAFGTFIGKIIAKNMK